MNFSMLRYLPHLVHSFYFCMKYFEFSKAIALPVFVHRKVEFHSLKGEIKLKKHATGGIKIGFKGSEISSKNDNTVLNLKENSRLHFVGNAVIGSGSRLSIDGSCKFGNNFIISKSTIIICDKKIVFGDNVLISWGVQIMDTSQHSFGCLNEAIVKHIAGEVFIGNNVWIGSLVTILKNSKISDNSIIATNTLINKLYQDSNILIAGIPGRIIKKDVFWNY